MFHFTSRNFEGLFWSLASGHVMNSLSLQQVLYRTVDLQKDFIAFDD